MGELPSGVVTFLFTDVEGSTSLLQAHPDAYRRAVRRHHDLLAAAVEARGGAVFETVGDAVYAAFARPADAIAAALDGQRALLKEDWADVPIKVRMGIHLGDVEKQRTGQGEHYFGAPLYRCARLMSTAHGGQTVLSEAAAALVRDALPTAAFLKDLGEHRLKDLARPERIWQLAHPDLPSDFAPLRTLDTLPNNLPLQVTSFVGRERELAEVTRLLGTVRLLTLTGAGGCGKTRLSLQVAAEALDDYPDGVFLVELAPVGDPAAVPATVAAAAGVREEEGRPLLTALADALRARRVLLVLDNCEHLIAACADLANHLIRSCPNVSILATSREGLGIAGETTWRVPSLSLPHPDHLTTVEALTQFEAVRLFIDRAKAAIPTFSVTEQNAPAIAQICHRLDGIPLAIELAAARVKALPVEQLVKRLEDRFRLLTGGSRTALPRQQTLQALVDWSYTLLPEQEKTLFARLAVFYGGFTLEATEAVCSGGAVDEYDVLDLLTRLVDKSLVLLEQQPDGNGRYHLLETLRQYARQKLLDSGESETTHDRHATYFRQLAEEAEAYWHGPRQTEWLARLESDHDNLRAALHWYVDRRAGAEAVQLAGALAFFWLQKGFAATEARVRLPEALALPGAEAPTRARVRAIFCWAGHVSGRDSAAAQSLLEECVALGKQTGEVTHTARALITLGEVYQRATPDLAEASIREALTYFRNGGVRWGEALAQEALALAALRRGDLGTADQHFDAELAIARECGAMAGEAAAIAGKAHVRRQQSDYAAARAYAEEALAVVRAHGSTGLVPLYLQGIADSAFDQGDLDAARTAYLDLRAIGLEQRRGSMVTFALGRLAELALVEGDTGRATALLGESLAACTQWVKDQRVVDSLVLRAMVRSPFRVAAALCACSDPLRSLRLAATIARADSSASVPPSPALTARLERFVEPARQALSWEKAAAAWAEGEAMSPQQAIAHAQEMVAHPVEPARA